jgi:hypothetical protein
MRLSITIIVLLLSGCCVAQNNNTPDEQFVQVYLHYGYHDEINTFEQTLQKDLIPDTVRIPFWFTKREQEIILTTAERFSFFSFPDTVYKQHNVVIAPDFGPQMLRIRAGNKDKTIVWFEPHDKRFKYYPLLIELRNLIIDIVVSKPEYKALPATKGGYQ